VQAWRGRCHLKAEQVARISLRSSGLRLLEEVAGTAGRLLVSIPAEIIEARAGAAMTETSDAIKYRVAVGDDEPGILALFKEVAPEIPIPPNDPKVEAKMITEIVQCRGGTWVAVDASGKVVGFALARPDLRSKDRATSLKYIGVSKSSRGLGISSNLMDKLKAKGEPLTASVLSGNQSAMADRLIKFGFTKVESDDAETKFRWNAQNAAQTDKV
jgi:ribosomal protein S18 acetylase RimI-like enzyme